MGNSPPLEDICCFCRQLGGKREITFIGHFGSLGHCAQSLLYVTSFTPHHNTSKEAPLLLLLLPLPRLSVDQTLLCALDILNHLVFPNSLWGRYCNFSLFGWGNRLREVKQLDQGHTATKWFGIQAVGSRIHTTYYYFLLPLVIWIQWQENQIPESFSDRSQVTPWWFESGSVWLQTLIISIIPHGLQLW